MYQILDKLFLYILGAVILLSGQNSTETVVLLLITFIVSGLFEFIRDQRLLLSVAVLYVLACLAIPELAYFLPLITYEFGIRKLYLGFLLNLMILFTVSKTGVFFLPMAIWFLSLGLGIYLSIRTQKFVKLKDEMIRMRDNSTELNLALSAKNQALIANQENEIHLATLQERNRIAREIHDSVGHMLSRCILQIGALSTIYKEEPLAGQLKSINDSLNTAMNNIRESVHDLRDASVDLRFAIAEATKEMKDRYDLQVDYDMSAAIPNSVKYTFLMIVKEALANVIKHSNATGIRITLREHPGFYQLAIEDNGTAFRENTELHDGMGLSNMADRIAAMHGTFRYGYEDGFRIFASIPKN